MHTPWDVLVGDDDELQPIRLGDKHDMYYPYRGYTTGVSLQQGNLVYTTWDVNTQAGAVVVA